jgi:hypothetical protein
MAWVRTTIEIPKSLKPREREVFGEAVVEFIRQRTLSGLDKNNRKFAKYTKEYAERKGVSRDDVDLFLDGEMLENLKVLSHSAGKIMIGYDKGDEINGKAEGNILGTYGQPSPVTKPRDFLGITKKDLGGILRAAESEDITLTGDDIDAIARKAATEILGINFDD